MACLLIILILGEVVWQNGLSELTQAELNLDLWNNSPVTLGHLIELCYPCLPKRY